MPDVQSAYLVSELTPYFAIVQFREVVDVKEETEVIEEDDVKTTKKYITVATKVDYCSLTRLPLHLCSCHCSLI